MIYFYQTNVAVRVDNRISGIQLFPILEPKIGEAAAEALINFIENKIKENNEAYVNVSATQEELYATKLDVSKLENKITEMKTDVLRWMFVFFFATAFIIFRLYFRK